MTAANLAVSEEYEIFSRYRETGDKNLRDEIVSSYMYIAEIIAHRFLNRGIEYEDIYQVGCMGIMYAVERFDPSKGVKFATYATPTVMGEIRKYFRDKGNFIKVPRKLYEIFYKAERIKRDGENGAGEVSRILDISEDVLQRAYDMGSSAFVESLESEAYADGNMNVANLIGYEDDHFMMIENSDFISYCMDNLSRQEREFVHLRYYDEHSQREIAEIMGLSQMTVSRMEKNILKKIRELYFKD